MTATTTTTTTNNNTETDTAAAGLELLYLDPAVIEIDRNVRDTVDRESAAWAELVASIGRHGILHPPTAIRYADGTVKIRDGQRRTLAAREIGLATIPVLVSNDTTTTDKERGFGRIVGQIENNDHHAGLTDGQRAAAVAEMLDLGITQKKIREHLPIKADQLKLAAKVGRSATARAKLDSGQLDLEQAAILGAFEAEGDDEAVKRLLDTHRHSFRYTANRIVAEREAARERAAAAAPWAEQGYTILEVDPEWQMYEGDGYVHLHDLVTDSGDPATVAHTEADPARWAVWITEDEDGTVTVTATGDVIDHSAVDWGTEGDDDATPADGCYHVNEIEVVPSWQADYYTLDPAASGLVRVQAAVERAANNADAEGSAAARFAHTEAEQKEKDRENRRQTIRFNKLGQAALLARREWLRSYLTRKTPPPSAAGFVFTALAADPYLLTQNNAQKIAAELLGIDETRFSGERLTDLAATSSGPRNQVLVLALVLGAFEARTPKDAWKGWFSASTSRYLHFLAEIGHSLTEIEEVMAGDRKPKDVSTD